MKQKPRIKIRRNWGSIKPVERIKPDEMYDRNSDKEIIEEQLREIDEENYED